MSGERARIPSSVVKVGLFTVITAVLTGLLGTLIGNVSFAPARTYYAVFSDAAGVFKGDRVRVSGVEVGTVKGMKLVEQDGQMRARLEFTVQKSVPIYANARLQLRFENIVGQRYLNIAESPTSPVLAKAGSTFPLTQTTPALNLTQLFNGFQPLFRALDPDRLNAFSLELVRALQGEAGTMQSLLRNTAQLTNTLADRDAVIGQVIANLNTVLATVGVRDQKLTGLILRFRDLMSGLADSSRVIGSSLPALGSLLDATAGTVADIRAPLRSSIRSLGQIAGQLDTDRDTLDNALHDLPFTLRTLARTASYGSWFNFYVCGIEIDLTLLDGTVKLGGVDAAANEKGTVCAGGVR